MILSQIVIYFRGSLLPLWVDWHLTDPAIADWRRAIPANDLKWSKHHG